MGFLSFLLLVAALGNLTSGIVLLAKQRRRLRGAPVTVLSYTAFALLLGLIGLSSWYYGGPFFVFTFLLWPPAFEPPARNLGPRCRTWCVTPADVMFATSRPVQ